MTAAVQPGGAAADRFGGRLRVAAADRPFVIALLAALAAFLLPLPAWLLDGALALLISFSAFVLMAALFAPRPQDFAGFPALLRNAALAQLCLNLATTRGIVLQAGQGPDAAGRIVAAFDGFLSGSGLVVGLAIGVLLMTTLFLIARAGKVRDKIGGTPEKLLVAAGLGVPLLAALDLVGGGLLLAARSGLPLPAVVPDTARLATADGLALLLPLLLLALALVAMDRKLRRVTAPTIATPATAISAAGDPATAAAAAEAPSPLAEALRVDPVRLELGFGLLDLLDENGAAALGKRIEALRRQLAADKGIVLPALRIRENLQLPTFGYRFCIREIEAVQGRLRPQKLRICDPRGRAVELPGEPAEAPDGGLPAKWCEPALQADADRLGYRVATPLDVIAEQ
ncbi:MAG TPA: FHIPEP family type III secretion protein, partial [Kiloniellaceae bacterium]|nr:FHIPEP family type III secretion protein [Kiloniellaceae bacterium]